MTPRVTTRSPDGKYLVFNSDRLGGSSLFLRASDGSGVDVPLAKFEKSEANRFTVASWSRADVLIFNVLNKNRDMDLWTLSLSGNRTRRVFVSSKTERAQWHLLARRPMGRLPVQRVGPLRNRRPAVPEQGPRANYFT